MRILSDSQAIFTQLAHVAGDDEGLAVKLIIENHDACYQNEEVGLFLTAAMRAKLAAMPRHADQVSRIEGQRQALRPLVVSLKSRFASAG